MDFFVSNALGTPNEYRSWFTDQVALVTTSRFGNGGNLACRPVGSGGYYSYIFHTAAQVNEVLLDHDRAEMGIKSPAGQKLK